MATRMQQRRGTASQWTSANPVLNAGEMGWESDTNKFKIGDGTNHWANLDYFIDANSTVNPSFGTSIVFEGATADSYETTLQVTDPTADRTITFPDATGTVALTSDIAELSQDAIDTALTAGTGITKTYNDAANTLTLAVDTTTIQARVADVSDTEIGYLNGVTSAIQTQLDAKAPTVNASFTGTFSAPSGTITSTMIADGTIVDGDISGTAAIALSKLATDPLARANHTGTQTASTISDFDTQVRTSRLDQMAVPTASVALNAQKITGLATPTDSTDAATKAYVDAVTEGLHIHPSVVAATTANVVLASALENGDTLDGVTLATNDRILVKNQTTTSENGIYIVQASGQPSRATDFDTASEVDSGDFVFVSSGTANGSTGWVQTNKPATIGTDPILFTQFAGAGTYTAGTGLTLTGTVFSINTATTVDLNTAQTLTNKTLTSPTLTTPDLGTPSSLTLTNATGLPINGLTSSTSAALGLGSIELGHASDTTIARGSAGVVTIEGVNIVTTSSTDTLTNKTLTSPVITGLTLNDSSIVFEGATANDFETTLTVTDPTADRTLTLPDATGTLLSTALFSAKGTLLVGTGTGTFTSQSVGADGFVLTADSAEADGVKWVAASGGAAFNEFMLIGA
jgi:hypothetical protein